MLESAAGGASYQVGKMMDQELHKRTSEYRELSQKLRSSKKVAGEEMSRKLMHRTLNKGMHPEYSENREHSQNSWKKQARADIGNIKVTVSTKDNQCSAVSSDFLEHSQNLLSNGEPEVDKGEVNVSFRDGDGQCLTTASEF